MHIRVTTSNRSRRTAARFAAGATLLASLAVAGPAGTVNAAAAAGCASAPANARVAYGHTHGKDPNSVSRARAKRMQSEFKARRHQARASGRLGKARTASTITVRTYVHVLRRDDGTGGASQAMVTKQMSVLNNAYAGKAYSGPAVTPFRFSLAGVDFTDKTAWFNWGTKRNGDDDAQSAAAKRALHKGTMEDLNLYVANLSDGILGYATFPFDLKGKKDGVVLLDQSLPGGNVAPYNEGDTATHEVGHWLGLFHTFQGGCTPPGDFVNDTPFQDDGDNIFFCGDDPEFGNDTCKQPGLDPVHNFMSYGDDPCLNQFTSGQGSRMVDTWALFRQGF